MINKLIAPELVLTLGLTTMILTGCQSPFNPFNEYDYTKMKPKPWSKKVKKYGRRCEGKGFERGSLDFYTCVNDYYEQEVYARPEEGFLGFQGTAFIR